MCCTIFYLLLPTCLNWFNSSSLLASYPFSWLISSVGWFSASSSCFTLSLRSTSSIFWTICCLLLASYFAWVSSFSLSLRSFFSFDSMSYIFCTKVNLLFAVSLETVNWRFKVFTWVFSSAVSVLSDGASGAGWADVAYAADANFAICSSFFTWA